MKNNIKGAILFALAHIVFVISCNNNGRIVCTHLNETKTWIFMIHLHLQFHFHFLLVHSSVRILISFNDMVFCSIYTTRLQPNIDIIFAPIALIMHSYLVVRYVVLK